jgi:hypothetical protein
MKRDLMETSLPACATGKAVSLSARNVSHPARPRLRLSRQQRRAAAQDWQYFELQLFAHIAEQAPHLLTGPWQLLHDLVRASRKYWMYPKATVGEHEDGVAPEFIAYLDLDALHTDWASLKERVWVVS